jgi:hypothetical protein
MLATIDVYLNVVISDDTLKQQLEEILLSKGNNIKIEIQNSRGVLDGDVTRIISISGSLAVSGEPLSASELDLYLRGSILELRGLGVEDIRIREPEIQPTEPVTEPATEPVTDSRLHLVAYPRRVTAIEGEEVDFVSMVLPSSISLWNLIWSRPNGNPLASNARHEQYGNNSFLKIVDVSQENAGLYRITATGLLGESQHLDVELHVEALDAMCEFGCGNGACILHKQVCDAFKDCSDGSDESACAPRPYGECFTKEFSCGGQPRCIEFFRVCDGQVDCEDQSDEANKLCNPAAQMCQKDEFSCTQDKCVKQDWVCDGERDCTGGLDEQMCGSPAPGSPCPPTHFACFNNQCVRKVDVCNGHIDCIDGSDEQVNVCREPEFTAMMPISMSVNQNTTLSLVCLTRGYPSPVVTFLKDYEQLSVNSRITMTSENGIGRLNIEEFNEEDVGIYTCSATNSLGTRFSEQGSDISVTSETQCFDNDLQKSIPDGRQYRKVATLPGEERCVEVVFLVDESGSMTGEHDWLRTTVPKLESKLKDINVGTGMLKNQYGLIGFGGSARNESDFRLTSVKSVGNDSSKMGNHDEFVHALDQLRLDGVFEDGYAAIGLSLDSFKFRDQCAIQFVLVTDEDRDIFNATMTYNNTLALLKQARVTLNVVVNQKFRKDNEKPLGIDSQGNAFIQDGKTYRKEVGATRGIGFGNTYENYVEMAFATAGAAWDLNRLRKFGTIATAFTAAFLDIKVLEIQTGLQRCLLCLCSSQQTTCQFTNIPVTDCLTGRQDLYTYSALLTDMLRNKQEDRL